MDTRFSIGPYGLENEIKEYPNTKIQFSLNT